MADYKILPEHQKRVMGWGKRPALLVVDVCKAWWTEGSPVDLSSNEQAKACLPVMKELVAAARQGGVPVVWTKIEYTHPEMADAGLFYLKAKYLKLWHVKDERKLFEDLPDFAPAPEDIVATKTMHSAFLNTTLASTLRAMDVDSIVFCGVTTSGAIRPSALEASGMGFRPLVVAAGCADKSDAQHETNLFDLQAKYADVVTKAAALEKLTAGWQ